MNMEFLRLRVMKAASLAALVLISGACGDDDPTGPGGGGTGSSVVSLSVGVPAAAPSPSIVPDFPFDIRVAQGDQEMLLDRVSFVVRNIKLESELSDCPGSESSSDDGCVEFDAGPVIVDLPVNGEPPQTISVTNLPDGTYDELRFKVHKPEDNTPEDLAFITANPEFDGVSILATGTFDADVTDANPAVSFTFVTDLNREQRNQITPFTVEAGVGGNINVTFTVDVDTWFRDATGALIDPATALKGEVNENVVKDNIEASIETFRDDDKDGSSDD